MASSSSKPPTNSVQSRKKLIIVLAILSVVLFGLTLAQSSFDLPFINPSTNQQIVFLGALSMIVFFLFVALTFVLVRNLIKVFAERRLGVLGSKFRTRLVVGSLRTHEPLD
jgi:two-component system nitrogen regulation sensor histidine kinase NtrY